MEKSGVNGTGNGFGNVPTPLRTGFETLRQVFERGTSVEKEDTEEVQDAVDFEPELSWAVSDEQLRAHDELILTLAAHLSEEEDSSGCSDTSFIAGSLRRFSLALVLFVITLLLLSPLALLVSGTVSTKIVMASSMQTQQIKLGTPSSPEFAQSQENTPSAEPMFYVSSSPNAVQSASPIKEELIPAVIDIAPEQNSTTTDSKASMVSAIDAIKDLWNRGRSFLEYSRCHQAEPLLSGALQLLDEERAAAAKNDRAGPELNRNALMMDQAFAMICMLRFDVAAKLLEQVGLNGSSMHMNALGYARFMLHDYRRAVSAFEVGLRTDPLNKLVWSNLAAAKLLTGDIRAADDAMYHALDPENVHFHADPWFTNVFLSNLNIIAQHAMGQRALRPAIEIWYSAE